MMSGKSRARTLGRNAAAAVGLVGAIALNGGALAQQAEVVHVQRAPASLAPRPSNDPVGLLASASHLGFTSGHRVNAFVRELDTGRFELSTWRQTFRNRGSYSDGQLRLFVYRPGYELVRLERGQILLRKVQDSQEERPVALRDIEESALHCPPFDKHDAAARFHRGGFALIPAPSPARACLKSGGTGIIQSRTPHGGRA